jgi:pimeloyl-ACP methyl ester carboxylesterase
MGPEVNGRRAFLGAGAALLALGAGLRPALAAPAAAGQVSTGLLDIAYFAAGPEDGRPVVLAHDFGYDAHSFGTTAALLADAGLRVLAPQLRGHGATRYLDPATPRSGQQAALGQDLIDFIDALHIPEALFARFGWGASAARATAAIRPTRCVGLVLASDEGLDDGASRDRPLAPALEAALWHQYYLQTARGREALRLDRRAVLREIWRRAAAGGAFDAAAFEQAAPSFDNPDWAETLVHAYRYRFGNAAADPRYARTEALIAARKPPAVPVTRLEGGRSARLPYAVEDGAAAPLRVAGAGHDLPRDAPRAFADAVIATVSEARWRTPPPRPA